MPDRMLTAEEWAVQKPPFAFIKIVYDSWDEIHYDIAKKWVLENAEGWVYFKNNTFIFGNVGDKALFRLWLEEGIFERESMGVVDRKAR